jgi:hypothetical protein
MWEIVIDVLRLPLSGSVRDAGFSLQVMETEEDDFLRELAAVSISGDELSTMMWPFPGSAKDDRAAAAAAQVRFDSNT